MSLLPWVSRTMAGVFVLFAILQWNDPDPFLWTVLYLVPAALSLAAVSAGLTLGSGLAYGALSVWWWNYGVPGIGCGELFGKIPWPDFMAAEPVRESLGLGVGAAWLLCLGLIRRRLAGVSAPVSIR